MAKTASIVLAWLTLVAVGSGFATSITRAMGIQNSIDAFLNIAFIWFITQPGDWIFIYFMVSDMIPRSLSGDIGFDRNRFAPTSIP